MGRVFMLNYLHMIKQSFYFVFNVSSEALVPVRLVRKYNMEQIKSCVIAVSEKIQFTLYKKMYARFVTNFIL